MNLRAFSFALHVCLLFLLPLGASAAADPPPLGWYAWKGMDWVEQKEKLEQLPSGTRRLLLSFTARQWREITQDARPLAALKGLVLAGKKRGVSLEFLLGEPTWVLPEGRAHLIRLLREIPAGTFARVHLDLERHQLPPEQQADWAAQATETLRAAVEASPIPVALTTHYRDLQPAFVQALGQAGVREIVPMIYVRNLSRVEEIVRQLPPRPKGMRLSVAQSVEREWSEEESSFTLGKRRALAHWQTLSQQLDNLPGFDGVIVQSWEEYRSTAP
jgi:hypothetical protein